MVAEGNDQGVGARGGRQEPCQHFTLTLGPESSQTLSPESSVTELTGLQPGTSYQVSVSALRGREEGPPVVIVARTGQTPRPSGSDPCFLLDPQSPLSDSHCLLPRSPCFSLLSPQAPPRPLPLQNPLPLIYDPSVFAFEFIPLLSGPPCLFCWTQFS